MLASRDFFAELAEIKAVRKEKVGIAIVGMRVDYRTHSTRQLIEYLNEFDLPLVTCIRSAQRYVQARWKQERPCSDKSVRDPEYLGSGSPCSIGWLVDAQACPRPWFCNRNKCSYFDVDVNGAK